MARGEALVPEPRPFIRRLASKYGIRAGIRRARVGASVERAPPWCRTFGPRQAELTTLASPFGIVSPTGPIAADQR